MAQQYFSRKTISGATNGAGRTMPLQQNTTSGNAGSRIIHSTASTEFDEIWLYGTNVGTQVATITLWWASSVSGTVGDAFGTVGGFGSNASQIQYPLSPGSGLTLLVPGLILGPGLHLNGSAWYSGATQNTNSLIVVYGFVNHIGPTM